MNLSGGLFNCSDAQLQNTDSENGMSDKFWIYFETVEQCLSEIRQKINNTVADRRIRIAVLDSGINTKHPMVQGLIQQTSSWNSNRLVFKSFTGLEDDSDPVGHGTHIVGTIMSIAQGARVYVGGVVDQRGNLDRNALAKALDHAVEEWHVDIVSLSLGFPKRPNKALMEAINGALRKEKLIFAAASNHGGASIRGISWPAWENKVFGVFSANFEGERSTFNPDENDDDPFSRYKFLGEAVKSAWLNDEEKRMTGTSVAVSVATSTAALFLEYIRGNMKGSQGLTETAVCAIERAARMPDGMRRIFAKVGTKRQTNDFLKYVTPWFLLDHERRHRILHRIDEALAELQLDKYEEDIENLEESSLAMESSLSKREAEARDNQGSFDGAKDDLRIQVLAVLTATAVGSSSVHVLAPLLWWATGPISLALVWAALSFARDRQGEILTGYGGKAANINSKLQDAIRLHELNTSQGDQTMEEVLSLVERIISHQMTPAEKESVPDKEFNELDTAFQELQLVTLEEEDMKNGLAASEESRAFQLLSEIGRLMVQSGQRTVAASDEGEEHMKTLEKAKTVLEKATGSIEKLGEVSRHFDEVRKDLAAQELKARSELTEKVAKEAGNILEWLWWILVWLGVGLPIIVGLVAANA